MAGRERMMKVDEVMERLGVSKATAYLVIKRLNAELEAKGLRTIPGRVSERYFDETYFSLKGAEFRYEDAYGRSRSKCKRGFATEADADRFERHFKARESKSLDISFLDFIELYEDDVAPQLKENTWRTKEYIINDKLVPFFGPMIMTEVTTLDAVRWQNALLKGNPRTGRPYTDTYLRTVNNQAVSIFNHAERFYKLKPNPFKRAPRIVLALP